MTGVVVKILDGISQNRLQVGALGRYGMHTAKALILGCHHGALGWSDQAGLGCHGELHIPSLGHGRCALSCGSLCRVLVVTVLPSFVTLKRTVALLDLVLQGIKCVRIIHSGDLGYAVQYKLVATLVFTVVFCQSSIHSFKYILVIAVDFLRGLLG